MLKLLTRKTRCVLEKRVSFMRKWEIYPGVDSLTVEPLRRLLRRALVERHHHRGVGDPLGLGWCQTTETNKVQVESTVYAISGFKG